MYLSLPLYTRTLIVVDWDFTAVTYRRCWQVRWNHFSTGWGGQGQTSSFIV